MFVADTFAAFMDLLKPVIRQQITHHVNTLALAQTMAVKVDLYLASEGRESGARTNAGKGGRGGRKFVGQKGELGILGGPSTQFGRHSGREKEVARVGKEELGRGQGVKENAKGKQIGQAPNLQLLQEGGTFLLGLP